MLKRNGRSSEAGFEEPGQEVVFHGSSVEPVVEFADIAIQALCLDLVVGSEQEALQVRERDVDPGKQRVGRFLLTRERGCGVLEALPVEIAIAAPSVGEDAAISMIPCSLYRQSRSSMALRILCGISQAVV